MSEPWYDRETHTYYGETDIYGVEPNNPMEPIFAIACLAAVVWLISLVFNRNAFSASEHRAFKRLAAVRDEVKAAQKLIADPAPKPPDYSITVGLTKKP